LSINTTTFDHLASFVVKVVNCSSKTKKIWKTKPPSSLCSQGTLL